MAATRAKTLSHPEVARAIEQDLIYALVTCLTGARVQEERASKCRHALIMSRFEEVLTEHLIISRPLSMQDLCELTGVAGRTLGWCCREFLGISPSRYILRRRLMEVRATLRNADPDMVNVTEVARRHGFTQLGRFAGAYRAVFGESPSTTLNASRKYVFRTRKFSRKGVWRGSGGTQTYRYRVTNSVHRYYASAAIGYPLLPVVVQNSE
jgi:transcriptional regulator GlxA family with amidase domain